MLAVLDHTLLPHMPHDHGSIPPIQPIRIPSYRTMLRQHSWPAVLPRNRRSLPIRRNLRNLLREKTPFLQTRTKIQFVNERNVLVLVRPRARSISKLIGRYMPMGSAPAADFRCPNESVCARRLSFADVCYLDPLSRMNTIPPSPGDGTI